MVCPDDTTEEGKPKRPKDRQPIGEEGFAGETGEDVADKTQSGQGEDVTFGIILLVSALHDFWVGPKVTALAKQFGNPSPEVERWRKLAAWLGRLNLLLALLMVAFGVMLVRGRPF